MLSQLRVDFPDITISKIRFLEDQGLVQPDRTPSGYRKFSASDVARLRYVLSQQRDHYLPLRVIKDQLEAIDRGQGPSGRAASAGPPDDHRQRADRRALPGRAGGDAAVAGRSCSTPPGCVRSS